MFFVARLAGGILANKKEGFICIRQGADWGQRENDGSIFLFLKLKQNIQARRHTGASSDFLEKNNQRGFNELNLKHASVFPLSLIFMNIQLGILVQKLSFKRSFPSFFPSPSNMTFSLLKTYSVTST